ncbi:MAG: hypothetical protein JWO52_1667 [Gammaproteobacteria bacterium]|nr:hypothetical protein [Gammaproteobacteria bacterium]
MSIRRFAMALSLLIACAIPSQATPTHSTAADTVTRLADEFVADYKRRFPFTVMYTGLPLEIQSDIDINSPRDLTRWRRFVRSIAVQLDPIPEAELVGRPEWILRAYLSQGIAEAHTAEVCRSELWDPSGWASRLRLIADAQPVATAKDRREAIERWSHLSEWIDQEALNLAQGLRAGYSGYRDAVESEVKQIDTLIAAPSEQWPTTALAKRANDAEFARQLSDIATNKLRRAAKRYNAFLQTEYLPKARVTPSIIRQPQGMACLRARLMSSTTVDMDPNAMFDVLVARRQAERARILDLARQAYNVKDLSWEELSRRLRTDPRDTFHDAEEIRSVIEPVLARARSALTRMVITPPSGDIRVQPVPDYLRDSAPAGQLFPASNDGTRPATFAYRGVPERFHRVVAESLTLHETIPGHYLQLEMLAQEQATPLHPITRIVMVEGSREGWATYAEGWAAELGLYSGAFDEMGSYVNSVTPSAVADLGMQIKGWSVERAAAYLHEEWPFDKDGQVRGWAANLASSPVSGSETYAVDGLQYEAARKRAQDALGPRFDSREYHQMLLSEGALPIPALNSKVDRWIAAHR